MVPRVILYNAVSLDGRFDWFTPDIGLFYSLVSCWNEDATLVGSETILAQEETLLSSQDSPPEVEHTHEQPLLVVPDSRGRIRCWDALRKQPYWRDVIVLCSTSTPPTYLDSLKKQHIEYLVAGSDHVDFKRALEELYTKYKIRTIRVDSGGTLNGVLLRAGLVHEISILVHPVLVGGVSPRSLFVGPDLTTDKNLIHLRLIRVERQNNDALWLRYEVIQEK